jgi:hypothetical protein
VAEKRRWLREMAMPLPNDDDQPMEGDSEAAADGASSVVPRMPVLAEDRKCVPTPAIATHAAHAAH